MINLFKRKNIREEEEEKKKIEEEANTDGQPI